MKNQFKEKQRQIEKSIKGDYNQNVYYFYELHKKRDRREKKETTPRLIFKNGKLIRTDSFNNGVPFDWNDKNHLMGVVGF